jgi:hypothetical protein
MIARRTTESVAAGRPHRAPVTRRGALGLSLTIAVALAAGVVSGGPLRGVLVSLDFRSIDDYIAHVPFWKQRFDVNGDDRFDDADLYDFIGRKGAPPGTDRFHFGYDFDGDDRVDNADINLLFDLARRFPDGYQIDPVFDVPTLGVIAAYYPWFTSAPAWDVATSIPVRGRYNSFDPAVYLQQRLEAHAAGIDIFAVSTSPAPEEVGRFHAMQADLERTQDPALTRFLWLYEILGRLPFTLNEFGQEIVNFDHADTRESFIGHMLELAGYFHANYLTIDGTYYPVWIWKTDTIRGDFVRAVSEARDAVKRQLGKDVVIVGGELAQFPSYGTEQLDAELVKRLPAFFAMTHYGIYTPRFTELHGGELSFAHTDFTVENLLEWIRIVRRQGANNIYRRTMEYWPPLQFGFDDRNVPGRHNPTMSASPEQIEYYIQQLDAAVVTPNADIVRFLNHTSYNEHAEGHGMEPVVGYNEGRRWIRLNGVYRGPSRAYRRLFVDDPQFTDEFTAIFAPPRLGSAASMSSETRSERSGATGENGGSRSALNDRAGGYRLLHLGRNASRSTASPQTDPDR